MRLLITIPDLALDSGGPSLSATRIAENLAALGATVAIAFGDDALQPPQSKLSNSSVTLLPIPDTARGVVGRLLRMRRYSISLLAHARTFRPDLICDFGAWLPHNAASSRVARQLGVPWISSPRGMLEPWSFSSKRLKKRIAWALYQKRLLQGAAAVVATSPDEENNLHALLPGSQIWMVPNGVDLPPAPPVRAGSGPRQAVFLSRLDPKKQPDTLIRVWSSLRPMGWRLVIAGPGPQDYRHSLQNLILSLDAQQDIELQDACYGTEKENLLFGSQLFILPTLSENFGIAVAEALAHSLPVITTHATPWHELPQEGCGWIVPPTEAGLRSALGSALAQSQGQLADMGKRGRVFVERYSWRSSAERLLDACHGLLGLKN